MVDLHSRIYGEGPPLLVLHGLFGSGENWHSLARRWGREAQVHVLDLRNHGRSPHHPSMNYEVMVEDVSNYIQKQDLSESTVLGHSMGGKVAMLLATREPDLVRGLVSVDMGPGPSPTPHAGILEVLRTVDPGDHDSRNQVNASLLPHVPEERVRQFLLKNLKRTQIGGLAWKFDHRAILLNHEKLLAAIPLDSPFHGATLFIRGEKSPYLPDSAFARIREYFPQARMVTLTGAGHWVHADVPDALSRELKTFMTDLS